MPWCYYEFIMFGKQPTYTAADERQFEKSHLNVEQAYERAQKVLTENEIDMDQFTDYDKSAIEHDKEEVQRLEGLFELAPSKIYADIFEAIACEYGELSDWFGPKSQVIKTARFDDYINKIDMIVETETGNQQFSHLALGVDVTFGSRDLSKKFAAIKAKIDSGELGQVKYFHSDRQNFTGPLPKIPQVVLGVEIDTVKELTLLWVHRRNKELAAHPAHMTLLEETALQLRTFGHYARATGKRDLFYQFDAALQRVSSIMKEKKEAGITGITDDKVFLEIQRQLLAFAETE